MEKPLISVIIPIYNSQDFLSECVSSILNQSYTNLEILLVDDGSTDDSLKICNEYKKKDNRIIVIHQENGGVAVARNTGLKRAKGEYISWVDSDDKIGKDYIEKLYSKLIQHKADAVMTYKDEKLSGDIVLEGKTEILKNYLLGKLNAYLWSTLILKSAYDGLQFEKLRIGEDALMLCQIMTRINRLIFCFNAEYFYRVRNDSISAIKNYESLSTWLQGVKKQSDIVREAAPETEKYMKFKLAQFAIMVLCMIKDKKEMEYASLRTELKQILRQNIWGIPWRALSGRQIKFFLQSGLKLMK